jgi:large subunit ribosomal protein L7/L12
MGSVAELVDQVNKLSDPEKTEFVAEFVAKQNVLWLSGTVKALEEKFGVKAQAAVAVGAVAAAPGAAPAAEEAGSANVDIIIKNAGPNKLNVIKAVRQIVSGLGLKEAKDLVEKGGKVKESVPKEEAEKIKKELTAAGAEIEIK